MTHITCAHLACESNVTIVESAIFFKLLHHPKTAIHCSIPLLIDYRGNDVERVVSKSVTNIPDWITDQKPKVRIMKFAYVCPLQTIECTYYALTKILKCSGIRYKNTEIFEKEYSSKLLNILDTSIQADVRTTRQLKAIAKFHITKPWNKYILADIITVHVPRIEYPISVCEQSITLDKRRLFSVAIDSGLETYVKTSITCDGSSQEVTVIMSRLPDESTAEKVRIVFNKLFKKYVKEYSKLENIYPVDIAPVPQNIICSGISNIKNLRMALPELFTNNYSRECTVLPVMIKEEQVDYVKNHLHRNVIYYPKIGPFGRYYTSPNEHFFVGLKKNRLPNKDIFPYLVTCYRSDHSTKSNSETYKYENDYISVQSSVNTRSSRTRKNKPIPRVLMIKGVDYSRKNVDHPSFIRAIETATGIFIDESVLPDNPQVVKQELWDKSDDHIVNIINDRSISGYGSTTYRYFEELLKISIHVIVTRNNNLDSFIPQHNKPYIWSVDYHEHIIIFENFKTIYGETFCSYDVLVDNCTNRTIFDNEEPIVKLLVTQKCAASIQSDIINIDKVEKQLIDKKGKCRMLLMYDGNNIETLTRPLIVPTIEEPACFLDSHILKLNIAKKEAGLPVIDVLKVRHDESLNYFPNNSSFLYWLKKCQKSQTDISSYESFLDTMDGLQGFQTTTEST